MRTPAPYFIVAFIALLQCVVTPLFVSADAQSLSTFNNRAGQVEDKRVEKRIWKQSEANSIMNKRFPIGKWDKHFSSLGGKRSPIDMKEGKEKAIFETKMFKRKEIDFEMSRWNDRMADLHKKAGIEMSDQAQMVANRQLYNMMLQNTQSYTDLGDEVSLRDINRFQFRRNHSDDAIPVEKAGSAR